jgi:hypothetical protein
MTLRPGERAFSLAACAVMFLWPVVTTDFEEVNAVSILIALGALILGALVLFRNAPIWLVTAFAVAAGLALRLTMAAYNGSDVAAATSEALHAIAGGLNPYQHYFASTHPAGQPFPYMPGELALYGIQKLIAGNLHDHDRWWSVGALLGIASLGAACGAGRTALATALLAVSSTNVLIGVDGSNDTGLLFLLIAAVVALAYAMRAEVGTRNWPVLVLYVASGAFFGWAIAFKAMAWVVFPFVLRVVPVPRRALYIGVALGVAAVFCLPFFIAAPLDFFASIGAGFDSHGNVWGFNVWAALAASHPAMLNALVRYSLPVAIFATLFTALSLWARKPGTLGEALLQSCTVLAAMLLFARWTSLAYYAFLIGVLALGIGTYGVRGRSLTHTPHVPTAENL